MFIVIEFRFRVGIDLSFFYLMTSRRSRSISTVAPEMYLISQPMMALVPLVRCTYASTPCRGPPKILLSDL